MQSRVYDLIQIDADSAVPKYRQLADSILNAIEIGKMKKDDVLPSINEITYHFDIGKVSVEKGYSCLKKIGVLGSVPGKTHYIKNTNTGKPLRVLLLFIS